ncbi:MAG: hypothetical protein J4N95_03610 [Chloroflexi bacterium]|nr:hypothetical protein [Chloroflexota bacterium]MCI0855496.1 hypothetical protein [Chloroflexota bacterium]MCI0889567.1 hypothetical protein [Chloroflexota bacterium]
MSSQVRIALLQQAAFPIAAATSLILATVGVACAASSPEARQDPSPTLSATGELTAAEAQLLRQIPIIDRRVLDYAQLLVERLAASELNRESLFQALSEAEPSLEFSRMFEVAIQLGPVTSLQSDHERYIRYLRDISARGRGFEAKVEGNDLVAVHQYAVEIMVARAVMMTEVSPNFCMAALVNVEDACESTEARAGGDYGVALRSAFRLLDSQIGPRVGFFPSQYEEDELEAAIEDLLVEVAGSLRRTMESVQGLEPPPELRAVHERIMRFLSESLTLLDVSELQRLRRERMNVLLEDFLTLTDDVTGSLRRTMESVRAFEPRLELGTVHQRIMRFLSESLTLLDLLELERLSLERLNELLEDFAVLTEETGNDLSAAAKAIVSPFFNE